MSEGVCKIFLKIDILFKDGKPDLKTINTNTKYARACPIDNTGVNNCKDYLAGIDALYSRLFNDLFQRPLDAQKRENNDNQYAEYVLIWLGSKLFHTESYRSSNLNDFYKNYLENTHRPFNYNDLIEKKRQLLDANLYYMSLFYQLFQEICYINLKYKKTSIDVNSIRSDSTRFHNKYTSLYNDIKECDSYLNLLNNLKTEYENLKTSLIRSKRNRSLKSVLSVNLKNLPSTKKANKKSTIGFDCPKCKKINSNAEKKKPKSAPKASQPAEPVSPPAAHPLPQQVQSVSAPAPPSKPEPVKPKEPESSQQPKQKPPESLPPSITTIQKESPGSQSVSNSAVDKSSDQGNKSKSSDSDQRNTASEMGKQGGSIEHKPEQSSDGQQQISNPIQGNSSGGPENSDGLKKIGQKPPENGPEKQSSHSKTKEPSQSETSQQEQLQTQQHSAQQGSQNISDTKKPQKEESNHPNGQGDSKNETKGLGSENRDPNGEANEPGTPSGGAGEPPSGSHAPSQDDKSDITNSPDQAGSSSASEESIDLWSPFFKLILNGKEYFNKASDFIEQNRKRFNDAKDKISNVYNDAVDNLKSVYNASSIYFSDIINNITNQPNQVDTPSKSGVSGDKLPQSSDQSKETGDPPPPQPSTPLKGPSPSIQLPPIQQKQSSSQLQPITQGPTQVNQPNHQKIDQLVKSLCPNPNLRKTWNIFPTTWSGSGDCKPEVKLMNTTLVCCTSEQCSLTGITVTLVLIPIILLIAYKYLPFGSSKKSEKKNMKRVINFHDGNRKTQIIIKSYDRNKDLKPVISSVDRKKDPLLNIYKLMQADPVPFINLFFLLIFFVYKRKLNYLEL
ncbi:PIR protein CIR protein [Plasmodium vinckei lentum]|uniref:PIR protein CIR protein n=1 Tax=Plasmodium vinckei lentum TaxID=138297 RepID=A0A6V7SHB7_PLAVN|nr:PIR protein CIR protein [Plasmodium vinckei lentum]